MEFLESILLFVLCLPEADGESGLVGFVGLYVDELAALFACSEHYYAVDESEESVVLAHTYIKTGMVLCAALTLDDVAGFAVGATEDLHAEAFAF